MPERIIRSLCYFAAVPGEREYDRLQQLAGRLRNAGWLIQTLRVAGHSCPVETLALRFGKSELLAGTGSFDRDTIKDQYADFMEAENISMNLEISDRVTSEDVDLLFRMIDEKADRSFLFSYTFCNAKHSPFFPAAHAERSGFSIGLQPTNLAEDCNSLHTWLFRMKEAWTELLHLFEEEKDFIGIDSSVAPMYNGHGSLVHMIRRICGDFSTAVTSDVFVNISRFIREENPRPAGLNGIMFPCLEDFELADEYELGHFSIERNIFLSLHSGLGIDTYPIGLDEKPDRVRQILNLLLALARKYQKPLSARFISDGMSKTGERSNFRNQYLKDVIIRHL
ncbi:MAG TPA: DUF711 family protein [Bacteroidales bacterium]|nr:DUF711 family protein [Bacteroidales bacterium]HSA42466.1 DUF711 family protein [Bacteroidales bacterium]